MIDFTVLSAALNKVIMPSITTQMYRRAPAWQLVGGWSAEENVAKRANVHVDRFENNKMYIQLRTAYSSGIVNIAPGEKYRYGNPTLAETYSTIRTMVGSFQIQKALLNTTNKGAIVKPLTYSSEALSRDLAMDANRQVYGGTSGVICLTASSGSTSTTVALASRDTVTNSDIDYARYFPAGTSSGDGVYVKIGSNTPVAVSSQDSDNQITIASGLSWSAGDSIVKVNGSVATSEELDGLWDMIAASGTYQNLATSANAMWKSPVDSIAQTLVQTVGNSLYMPDIMHKMYFKVNKVGKVNWVVMNASLFQTYAKSLTSLIRFDQKEVLSGGWIGVDYMGGNAKVLLDYDCPDDRIQFLSSEDLVFGQMQPLEWEKGTDGILYKIQQQLDYEVTASWMGNLGVVARNTQGLMTNKTAS